MSKVFEAFAEMVTARPRLALAALAFFAIALGSGMGIVGEQADNTVFLPGDSEVAQASDSLSDLFPDSAGLTGVTILHRGDTLTPAGLSQIDAVVAAVVADPAIAGRLAVTDPVVSLAAIYKQALGVGDLGAASQTQIDQATTALSADESTSGALTRLSGQANGEGLVISQIKLRELGDPDGLEASELLVAELVQGVEGPLEVRSLSSATINEESAEST